MSDSRLQRLQKAAGGERPGVILTHNGRSWCLPRVERISNRPIEVRVLVVVSPVGTAPPADLGARFSADVTDLRPLEPAAQMADIQEARRELEAPVVSDRTAEAGKRATLLIVEDLDNVETGALSVLFRGVVSSAARGALAPLGSDALRREFGVSEGGKLDEWTGGDPLLLEAICAEVDAGASVADACETLWAGPPRAAQHWADSLRSFVERARLAHTVRRLVAGQELTTREFGDRAQLEWLLTAGWVKQKPSSTEHWTIRSEFHRLLARRVVQGVR